MSPYHGMMYQNGVFRKGLVEPWLRDTGWPSDVLPLLRQHPSYDEYWRGQDLGTRLDKVRWPIVHVGGWFDIFCQPTIDTFMALQEGGLERQAPATAGTRAYDYDPANPVPTVGGQELNSTAGPRDQRKVEARPDVLVFSTPPLTEPLEVTGRVTVRLTAATSTRDTDFTAKLSDVYPDGRSMLLTDGIVRARYRTSLAEPAPVVPGERYTYTIDLGSTSIVFNRGHRIRVAISSSNYPRFDANPNTWPESDAVPAAARQTITLGGAEASQLLLPEVVAAGNP